MRSLRHQAWAQVAPRPFITRASDTALIGHGTALAHRGATLAAVVAAALCHAGLARAAPAGCDGRVSDVIQTEGTLVEGGQHGTFRRRVEPGSGRLTELADLGIIQRGQGFDGTRGWSQDASGWAHYLNSPFARALSTSQAWLDARQGCPPEAGPDWVTLGRRTEGQSSFDASRVTPAGGAPVELWFDPATHRLDRAFFQLSETRLVRHFDDWRPVDRGHLVAFAERDDYVEDESVATFHVTAVRVKPVADRDDFALPAAPARHAHRGRPDRHATGLRR